MTKKCILCDKSDSDINITIYQKNICKSCASIVYGEYNYYYATYEDDD